MDNVIDNLTAENHQLRSDLEENILARRRVQLQYIKLVIEMGHLKEKVERVVPASKRAIKEAYASGYAGGHNDTVEGTYYDIGNEEAEEFFMESVCDEQSEINRLDAILAPGDSDEQERS